MLAATGKGNRIVTLDIPDNPGKPHSWRSSWNAGSRMAVTSAC